MEHMAMVQRAMHNTYYTTGKEIPPNARFVTLENDMKEIKEKLNQLRTHQVAPPPANPAIVLTRPSPTLGTSDTTVPQSQDSFSNVLKNGRQPARRLSTSRRDISPSVKRGMNDDSSGFTEPRRRVKAKMKTKGGTHDIDLSRLLPKGVGGSVEYYVGNTTPELDESTMKTALIICYKDIVKDTIGDSVAITEDDLEVDNITPPDIKNPHSKSWKIKVPYKVKEIFDREDLYPKPWRHRKFFPPRSSNKTVPESKKPRTTEQDMSRGSGAGTSYSTLQA
jgi:hypothetical protein